MPPAGVVFMAGCVYAVGGFNGSLRVRTVDVYDGVKDQWTSIASMQERRSTLGAAVLGDLLYAVGGFDGSTGTATQGVGLMARYDLYRGVCDGPDGLLCTMQKMIKWPFTVNYSVKR